MMKTDANIYLTLFRPGFAGNWITWFVNRHRSFTRCPRQLISREVLDLVSNERSWVSGERSWVTTDYQIPDWQKLTYRSFNTVSEFSDKPPGEYWQKLERLDLLDTTRQSAPNTNFSKSCYTLHPHHSLASGDHNLSESIIQEYQVSGIIYPVVREANRDLIAGRQLVLKSDLLRSDRSSDKSDKPTFDDYCQETIQDIQPGGRLYPLSEMTKVHVLDLGKLMDLDDQEYQSLVDFIDEPPLEDWKQLMSNMVSEVYNGWWQGKALTSGIKKHWLHD